MDHISATAITGAEKSLKLSHPKLSPTAKKIVEGAIAVREVNPGEEDITYLHAVMTQVSLPRRKTAERFFERRSGNASLRIDAGVIEEKTRFGI